MNRPDSFTINSRISSRKLVFRDYAASQYIIELLGDVSTASTVDANMGSWGLCEFLSKLASYHKPWSGEEHWEALEGEFSLTATCSSLGEVILRVTFFHFRGGSEESHITVGIETELGQLKSIANRACLFFNETCKI